ncbi:nuclear transport factor 2-like protein [Actinophytocola xanthii]|uniref:Uncharacterized protein n=1 Tax=Actinophytocola xanthii TaxID=1912961 RepID=A0A1Q8CQ49_9PSEU|nr:hypothetical protein [Actinophytocola xanthii]OLF16484.1 hypothetical protein BU204_16710 [Actinophytocola xanthii]
MMESVADNEHQAPGGHPAPGPANGPHLSPAGSNGLGDAPTPPSGELIMPAQPPPAVLPPNQAAPLDPEQVRQFQEFQQFQQLMRQAKEQGFPQGQPPPPGFLQPWGPPPPKRGPVRRALSAVVGKIVTAVIVVLLLVAAGYFAIDYFLGGPPDQPKASEIGGGQQKTTLLFEESPRAAVQRIYDDVAQGDPEAACGRFTDDARAEFTSHFGSYGGDCREIVAALNAEVVPGQKSEYANPANMTSVSRVPATDTVTISSCTLGVRGGPLLGRLTVSRDRGSQGGNQWIVTAHEQESCTETPSAAPTS